jgi:hypothetical protein
MFEISVMQHDEPYEEKGCEDQSFCLFAFFQAQQVMWQSIICSDNSFDVRSSRLYNYIMHDTISKIVPDHTA